MMLWLTCGWASCSEIDSLTLLPLLLLLLLPLQHAPCGTGNCLRLHVRDVVVTLSSCRILPTGVEVGMRAISMS
jgi:hypothetical protein